MCFIVNCKFIAILLANPFVYSLQRIKDTVPASDSFIQFVYLFVDKRILTTLSQFIIFYSVPWSTLLQTEVLYLILHSLAIYIASTCYL